MECFKSEKNPLTFDLVIIDEAAQAVELSTLIPLQYGYEENKKERKEMKRNRY